MIVKFFETKANKNALGGINYLLHENRSASPEVLQGNIELTKQLLLKNVFKRAYTTGCLSFAEKSSDVNSKTQYDLMRSFEKTLLAGLEENQYDIVWVRHTDKKDGRLELNFHIVNREMTTNRRLQVYFDKYDRTRIDTWKSLQNDIYQFKDPDAPENRRFTSFNNNFRERREVVEHINEYIKDKYINNELKNRNAVLKALKEIKNITITRETKKSISIKHPNFEKPFRLKGEIYERNFRRLEVIESQERGAQKKFEAERAQRIESNKEKLKRLNNSIAEKRKAHFSNISSINIITDNSNVEQQLLADKKAKQQLILRSKKLQARAKSNNCLSNQTITNKKIKAILDESRQNKSRIDVSARAAIVRAESSTRSRKKARSIIERARAAARNFIRKSIYKTKRQIFKRDICATHNTSKKLRLQHLRERKAKCDSKSTFEL